MLRQKLKYRWLKARYGLENFFGLPNKTGGCQELVLVYHGVCQGDPLKYNSRFIQADEFEKHLQFFRTSCDVVKLDDMRKNENKPSDRLQVALTFDDGYLNNYSLAMPLLEKYDIPANFCVCNPSKNQILWPDLLDIGAVHLRHKEITLGSDKFLIGADKSRLFKKLISHSYLEIDAFIDQLLPKMRQIEGTDEYWHLVGERELEQIHQHKLFDLVPHSNRHISSCDAPQKVWQKDYTDSVNFLQSITGRKPNKFAYPYGHVSQEAFDYLTEKHQIEMHIGVDKSNSLQSVVPRFVINPHVNFEVLKRFMYRGSYQ